MSIRRLGNYQIIDYVGSGGFGSVFKAEDVNAPGRIVAIKELHKKHTRDAVIKQRFFQEAVAMARLDHPNLPRLYTFGEDGGSYYLVMEFISGKLLTDEIHEHGSIAADRAVEIISQVLEALKYAHQAGIIHRDLKPDNIILLDGDRYGVKVLDFGIARMVGGENLTLTGQGFGTPAYMSPERMAGLAGDDPRIDIYSAGIILFEMLSGKAPFASKATDPPVFWMEMRALHEKEPLPRLASTSAPAELDRVIRKATAKRVEDRYRTADEMLRDLAGVTDLAVTKNLAEASAQLSITTAPAAAEIFVDGQARGVTDPARGKILIENLAAGLHTVRVCKAGYSEYRISVSLEENHQTDLQVALAARVTLAMPSAEATAAAGFDTAKQDGGDEARTALLTVESLPAGSKLFVGARDVALAGEDGRATVRLNPGTHEVQVKTPSGDIGKRLITVAEEDAGSLKTVTMPIEPRAATGQRSWAGKRMAAAVAVVLVAVTYFAFRGPERVIIPAEPVTVQPAAPQDAAAKQAEDAQRAVEAQQKMVEAQQKDVEAAQRAIEARRKELEAAQKLAEKKAAEAVPPAVPPPATVAPAPPVTETPRQDQAGATPGNQNACVAVAVTGPTGEPMAGMKVTFVDQPEGTMPNVYNGRTGPQGRLHQCGLTPGHKLKILVFGPRGAVLAARAATVAPGRSMVEIRINQTVETQQPLRPRRRLFPNQ